MPAGTSSRTRSQHAPPAAAVAQVTLKTLREKCLEYTARAETLKKGLESAKGGGGGKKPAAGGGANEDDDDDDDDDVEPEPLTEEQLRKAEQVTRQ